VQSRYHSVLGKKNNRRVEMLVIHMKGFIINLVVWSELILRFRPFFP